MQVAEAECETAAAIMQLLGELSKQEATLARLCDGADNNGALFQKLCDAASGLSNDARVAAGGVVARVCLQSVDSHVELVSRPQVQPTLKRSLIVHEIW